MKRRIARFAAYVTVVAVLLGVFVFPDVLALNLKTDPTLEIVTSSGSEIDVMVNKSSTVESVLKSKATIMHDITLVDKESFDNLEDAVKKEFASYLQTAYEEHKMVAFIGNCVNLNQNEIYNMLGIVADKVIIEPCGDKGREREQYLNSFALQKKDDTLYISTSYLHPDFIDIDGKLEIGKDGISKEKKLNNVIHDIKDKVLFDRNDGLLSASAASNSTINNYDYKSSSYVVGNINTAYLTIVKFITKSVGTSYTMWGIESADYTQEVTGVVKSLTTKISTSKQLYTVNPSNPIGAGQTFNISLSVNAIGGSTYTIGGTYTNGAGSITDQSSLVNNYLKMYYLYATGNTHPTNYAARSTALYRNDLGYFWFDIQDTIDYYYSGQTSGPASTYSPPMVTMRFNDRGVTVS